MHADDRADPTGGTACSSDSANRFVKGRRIALQPAPLLRLQQLEESGLVELIDGLIGKAAQILGRLRALGDKRQQVVDAG